MDSMEIICNKCSKPMFCGLAEAIITSDKTVILGYYKCESGHTKTVKA